MDMNKDVPRLTSLAPLASSGLFYLLVHKRSGTAGRLEFQEFRGGAGGRGPLPLYGGTFA